MSNLGKEPTFEVLAYGKRSLGKLLAYPTADRLDYRRRGDRTARRPCPATGVEQKCRRANENPRRADEGRTQSRKRRADERTRTADLISLRVINHSLQGFA